ncbi:viral A-type inclusion protein, partial [Reticulomyxa filosa]
EIAHLKQQLDQYQKDNLQLNSVQVYYKTAYVEIEKLKKDIKSKDNEINKMKQEIQFKQTQIIQQIDENKQEQTQNIIHTSSTLDFQLVSSLKLNNTFTGHTKA